ncbi:MAG: hypothetical protein ACI9V8_001773 [Urechidicola sp.]|jgi:hypothetical protein
MILIHATKKLFAKLPVNDQGFLPEQSATQILQAQGSLSSSVLSGWHANLLTIQRRQCILLVHDTTRFSLFIPCLTKPDFANLNGCFEDALMNTLIKVGANDKQLDAVHRYLAPLQIDTDCNRSSQGSMNQMKADIEHMLLVNNVDIKNVSGPRAAQWLSAQPRKVKGRNDYIWPQTEMLSLLSDSAINNIAAEPLPDNVFNLKDYRNG